MNILRAIPEQFHMWAWRGVVTFALAVVLVYEFVIPEALDHGVKPVAEQVGVVSRLCPDGWKDVSSFDEHGRVLACERDGWLVWLTEDKEFSHGLQLDTPGAEFVFDPAEVPEW